MGTEAIAEERAFGALVEPHRRELQVHCYRMLGSFDEAEDMVQETLLRAWRSRTTYAGRATVRAWLYRIATNACLDALARSPRRPRGSEIPWLQPFPDDLLDELPADDDGPDAHVADKETIELAFLVAIQHLPPRTRAVLIVRDVLGWSAKETAALLETSVAAVNSALQRGRAALREHLPERRLEWAPGTDASSAERALVARYVEAAEQGDAAALAALMHEDARFSMPPEPGVWEGRDTIVDAWVQGGFGSEAMGTFRLLVTRANRQPALANYLRRPGDDRHRAFALDVLRIEAGAVVEIVTFDGAVFPAFGLPDVL